MEDRLARFIEETAKARTGDDLGLILKRELSDFGYENVVLAKTRGRKLEGVTWSEFPEGYMEAYIQNRWDLVDPVFEHALGTIRPFQWADAIDPRSPMARRQRRFMAECVTLGVHSGMTVPLHGAGLQCDLLSVSARSKGVERPGLQLHVYSVAVQAWLRQGEIEAENPPDETPVLTPRETEVLNWVKDGLTNWEIGDRMKISEKTVEFHLGNAMKKLGVNTRIQAMTTAIMRSLISL